MVRGLPEYLFPAQQSVFAPIQVSNSVLKLVMYFPVPTVAFLYKISFFMDEGSTARVAVTEVENMHRPVISLALSHHSFFHLCYSSTQCVSRVALL